jgi:release factor glutamine methyltransferase
MNENSPLKTLQIKQWLISAAHQLAGVGIGSAKLDAEIILAHTVRKSRTYLHAHDDESLTSRQYEIAEARLQLRLDRTPIAYIVGHKEFYGRLFKVTPATLIPRPESETIIEILQEQLPKNLSLLPESKKLIDVGTGSGCLGISAKLEFPELDVTVSDVSRHALNVAQENAKQLDADVTILQSNLLSQYPFTADYIVANLPYVDTEWERSPETNYEPSLALFAKSSGLELIYKLIEECDGHLSKSGLLILEADPRQHQAIIEKAKNHGLTLGEIRGFIVYFTKA